MCQQSSNNLTQFYSEFLNADTWAQRKDGVPLDLLDNLTSEELQIAEDELIRKIGSGDSWPIMGLAHIKSTKSLPRLYEVLEREHGSIRIYLAHAIYSVCKDKKMVNIVLKEVRLLEKALPKSQYTLIDVIWLLPNFNDKRIEKTLVDFCDSSCYLVAYNAANALGKPTKMIIEKFRDKEKK